MTNHLALICKGMGEKKWIECKIPEKTGLIEMKSLCGLSPFIKRNDWARITPSSVGLNPSLST
jgi:hypothetical protein